MTRLNFRLDTPLQRVVALDRRDGIIDALRELGVKLGQPTAAPSSS